MTDFRITSEQLEEIISFSDDETLVCYDEEERVGMSSMGGHPK